MNNLIEFVFLKRIFFALLCIYSATSAGANITAQYRHVRLNNVIKHSAKY